MISDYVYLQCLQALESIYAGVKICMIYEILLIIRGTFKQGKIIAGIEEYIYWCYVGVRMYIVLFDYNNGTIRFFMIAMSISGALIFHFGIGRWITKYTIYILRLIIVNVLKKTLKTVIITVLKLFKGKRRNDNVKKD